MRIFVAGLIGGIVLFVWGAISHMALPIGEMGMKVAAGQDAALAAVQASAEQGAGVYMVPGMSPDQWRDEAAMRAFVEKCRSSPYAFVVYDPAGNPAIENMAPNLVKQLVSDLLVGLLTAWIMALAAGGFGRRVQVGGAVGLVAWLAVSIPYWNWYRFPLDFTIGSLLDVSLGILIASVPMAWWLGRGKA